MFEQASGHANITRVTYAIASYGDVPVEGVVLLGLVLAYHLGVCDLLAAVQENVMQVDDEEGACDENMLTWDL